MSSEATTSARTASDEKRRVQNREAQRNRRRNVRQQLAHYEQLLQTMGLASRADSNIRDRHHHSARRTSGTNQDANVNPPSPSSPLGNHSAPDSASSPPGSAHGGSLQYPPQQASPQFAPHPPETSFYGVDTGLILSSLYEHEREPIGDPFGGGAPPAALGIDADYGYLRPDLTMAGAPHEYYSTSPSASDSRGLVEMSDAYPPNTSGAPMDRSNSYQQQWPAGGPHAPPASSSSRMSNASHSPRVKTDDDLAPNVGDMTDIQMGQAPLDLHPGYHDPSGRGFAGNAAAGPPSINPQQLQQQQQQQQPMLPPGTHPAQFSPQHRPDSQSPLGRRTSWTPLHHATNSRNIGMMVLLIQNGAEVSARDDEGNTALHLAARTGDAESMATLLQHYNNNVNNSSNSSSNNDSPPQPLAEASSSGSSNGSSTTANTPGGESQAATPATSAAGSAGGVSNASAAAKRSSSPPQNQEGGGGGGKRWIDLENSSGLTPLHLAVTSGHAHIVKMLIEAGADVNSRMPAL